MIRPAHNFTAITDADWARMLKAHRQLGHYHGNEILRRIRARVVAQSMVPPPQPIAELPAPKHASQEAPAL